jgi:hypothetical protein
VCFAPEVQAGHHVRVKLPRVLVDLHLDVPHILLVQPVLARRVARLLRAARTSGMRRAR